MDAVEPFDPDRRLAAIDLSELVLVFGLDRVGVADAIRVVRLVVEDQDVAFPSDVLPENAFDQSTIRFDPALNDPGADTADLVQILWRKHVPVADQHMSLADIAHQMRWDEVARPVEARLAPMWVELLEPVANRDIGTEDEDNVGEPFVAAIRGLFEDAPRREPGHDRGPAAARRHLGCIADERAGFVEIGRASCRERV